MVFFNELFQTVRLLKWYLHFDTPSWGGGFGGLGEVVSYTVLSIIFEDMNLIDVLLAFN